MKKYLLNSDQKDLILKITSNIKKYQKKYNISNIYFTNLDQVGKKVEFLNFDINIENDKYFVKVKKYHHDLIWSIFYGNKKIYREICISEQDVDRIYLLIQKYRKEQEIKRKYNLV